MYSTPFSFASRSPPSNSTHCAKSSFTWPPARTRAAPASRGHLLPGPGLDVHGDGGAAALAAGAARLLQQCAQRVAFLLDLLLRAEAEAPQHRQRRTPALQRVLEEERLDQHGEAQPAAPAREPGAEAGEREARREQLEGALDVPLAVEALEPLADARGIDADLVDALRDFPADAAIHGRCGVIVDAVVRRSRRLRPMHRGTSSRALPGVGGASDVPRHAPRGEPVGAARRSRRHAVAL